jgi:hypothetical protein
MHEHCYSGRALVGLHKITLLDLVDNSLPNLIGQLDVSPGRYHLELRLVLLDPVQPDEAIKGP